MPGVETQEFVLRRTSRQSRPLSVSFCRENGTADLTISADGEQLFSGRVLGAFAGILHTVYEMEEAAEEAKKVQDMILYHGRRYIARFGRTQVASRLGIPELAEYD